MLAAGSMTLLGLSIVQLIFGGSLVNFARVFIGVMLMCGYIVHDTQQASEEVSE